MPHASPQARRRARQALLVAATVLALGAGCRPLLGQALLRMIQPAEPFAESAAPPPPDYRSSGAWAALPSRPDGADRLPEGAGLRDGQAEAQADCFYVHGTTYADALGWNQPLYDALANARVDELVLPVQAAVFNGSCRVFAPRYRQASLYAFSDPGDSGQRALELAYRDVEAAFVQLVTERSPQRPLVLAGHSQGTRHLLRLLREHIAGSPLQRQLVIAYLPGWRVDSDVLAGLPDLPVCRDPTQTGCLVSWNAETADPRPAFVDLTHPDSVCVNPLTWTSDGQYAGHAFNLGGLVLDADDPAHALAVIPHASDAQCVRGGLRVHPADDARLRPSLAAEALAGTGVLHNLDVNLFYLNIREDVARRVDAHLRRPAAARGPSPDEDAAR